MENEIYTFKNEMEDLISKSEMKVWLAKKYGKRIEYIFKVGREQFDPPQKIAETEKYILFGENTGEIEEKLVQLFNQYVG